MNFFGFHYKIFYLKLSISKFKHLKSPNNCKFVFSLSTISPKICSIEEENPQSTIIKHSSISQFGEISDSSIDASSTEQQQNQSNLTIMSKLRNKFLLNNKQNPSKDFGISESTTQNLIFLSKEESDVDTSMSNI